MVERDLQNLADRLKAMIDNPEIIKKLSRYEYIDESLDKLELIVDQLQDLYSH